MQRSAYLLGGATASLVILAVILSIVGVARATGWVALGAVAGLVLCLVVMGASRVRAAQELAAGYATLDSQRFRGGGRHRG